jgi:hypothetical protein
MSGPAYLKQPNITRLPNLLREIQEGEIRIPRFQRPFIWTTEQRLLLLRSIYEGMPIGSILLWRTKNHDLKSYDHLGPLHLSWSLVEKGKDDVSQYVLDGHQRLTTLYVALGGGLQPVSDPALAGEAEEELFEVGWPIFFDLEDRRFKVQSYRGEPHVSWLPLSILLDPFQLYEFQKTLVQAGVDRALVNRAEALASTFKDYSIPVVPIVTEDLELATQSFQRVNSGGTTMNEVHMVSALTWSPQFDLNERMQEIRGELGEVGWQDLEEKMILHTCKAALDLDIYYSDVLEIRDAIKERPQVLREATDAIKAAAGFLKDQCKVHSPAVLPYSFQIVLLADAIQRGTDGLQRDLEPGAPEALARWFWLTTYTEYFAGISAVRLAKALEHIREVACMEVDPEPPGMSREVRPFRRFDFRSARSRAIALRMAGRQPWNGGPNGSPYQLLADHGPDALPMLFPSREISARSAEGPENRFLAHPMDAARVRRALREPPGLFPPDREFLKSHAVDARAAEALWEGDLTEFLRLRRRNLIDLERDHVENLGLAYSRG